MIRFGCKLAGTRGGSVINECTAVRVPRGEGARGQKRAAMWQRARLGPLKIPVNEVVYTRRREQLTVVYRTTN